MVREAGERASERHHLLVLAWPQLRLLVTPLQERNQVPIDRAAPSPEVWRQRILRVQAAPRRTRRPATTTSFLQL